MPEPSKPSGVVVRGSGVAAYCSALLLDREGIPVTLEDSGRARVPALMIGDATQALIGDVFSRPGLFAGLHRIERRTVAWGADAEPKSLAHSAVVLSEEQLGVRLRPTLSFTAVVPQWTIQAAPPLPADVTEHRFGSRTAWAASVLLRDEVDSATCWIESLENGWLFLIPNAPGPDSPSEAWLLSVGQAPGQLLADSQLIAPLVDCLASGIAGPSFPAYPRIADPLCGPAWIACGTAAMAFDPICGDGTGNAVREAVLAAAVVRAHAEFGEYVLEHYRKRLLLGFLRHLEQCRQFYATGHQTVWWRDEQRQVMEGITWCQRQLDDAPPGFQFQLRGFELLRIG